MPQRLRQVLYPLVRRGLVGKALQGNKRLGNSDDVTPQFARSIEVVGNGLPPLVSFPAISPDEHIPLILVHHFIWPRPRIQRLRGEEYIFGGEDAGHRLEKRAR